MTVTITLTQEDLDNHPEYVQIGWGVGTRVEVTLNMSDTNNEHPVKKPIHS